MKGLVFTEFLEMVETHFSLEIAERIIEVSDLPSGGIYTTLGTYDHDEIVQLVTHLSEETKISIPDLLFTFGKYLFGQFVMNHPWAIDEVESALDFLQNVHDYIHVEVRKLYPDAELPRFEYDTSKAGRLIMHYRSTRPLADLAHGLIVGCIEHYGEKIDLQRQNLSDESETSVRFVLTKQVDSSDRKGQLKEIDIRSLAAQPESSWNEIEQLKRRLERERQARKQAEELAEQKTRELYLANQKITSLNEQLKEENIRMGAELEVTRQLQRMLLPNDEELQQVEGLDIAGYIEPADEVGGDYYDVLQHDGQIKISIGDVTGHGLESGVVMLMTQMGIRTLLTCGETSPVCFIDGLNRTIYQNIQRMGVDKSMTLTLLDYTPHPKGGGQLSVSGQHEELIVVRRGGQVELVDTTDLGFPIGLEFDIADFVDQMTIELQTGDGIVLYTDGVTEAENEAGKQYGLERLCTVVRQYWDQSAETIKNAVIVDVSQHIGQQVIYDDITLLVLKQK